MNDFHNSNLGAYDRSGANRFWEKSTQELAQRRSEEAMTAEPGLLQQAGSLALDAAFVPANAVAGAATSIWNLGTAISNSMGTDFGTIDWKPREMTHAVPEFAALMGQFLIPYTGATKALGAASKVAKGAGLTKTARVLEPSVKTAIKMAEAAGKTGNATKKALWLARGESLLKTTSLGFAVDFAAYELNEERLADMLVKVPGLEGLEDYIGHDEDDSVFLARLKNAAEGAVLGIVGDYLMGMHRSRKAYKEAIKAGKSTNEAVVAGTKALGDSMAEAAVRREEAYEQFRNAEQTEFSWPEGSGGKVLEGDMAEARRHIDEATARGDVIDVDGTARPRVADEGGAEVDLPDAEVRRPEGDGLESDAPSEAPKETRPNLSEGTQMEFSPDTGQFTLRAPGTTRQAVADDAVAEVQEAILDELGLVGDVTGQDVLAAIKRMAARTDVPSNPRAKGPDGKLIDLPEDVSRNAGNLDARGSLLTDSANAKDLIQAYENIFKSQNWGAKMDKMELQEATIALLGKYSNLNGRQRKAMIHAIGKQSEEQLAESVSNMLALGHISNDYTQKASKLVDELLQHEDTPDSAKLHELANLFRSLGETHQHYTDHKSIFGTGLRAHIEDLVELDDLRINKAMDACGLKP